MAALQVDAERIPKEELEKEVTNITKKTLEAKEKGTFRILLLNKWKVFCN